MIHRNRIEVCTTLLGEYSDEAFAPDESRSKEIDYFIRRHEPDRFIILDDDPQLFDLGSKTGESVSYRLQDGFTERDVKEIVKRFV